MEMAGISSQQELAEKLSISQGTVSGWMNGAIPQKRMMLVLSSVLKCTPEWLRTGTGPDPQPGVVRETSPVYIEHAGADHEAAREIKRQLDEGPAGLARRLDPVKICDLIREAAGTGLTAPPLLKNAWFLNIAAFVSELKQKLEDKR